MVIEDMRKSKRIHFEDLQIGDCFEFENKIYMAIPRVSQCLGSEGRTESNAVSISSPVYLEYFRSLDCVTLLPDIKIVIR